MRAFHLFSVVLAALACLGWQAGAEVKEPVALAPLVGSGQNYVQALAISPDGKTLAAGARSYIEIWDLTTREQRALLIPPGKRHILCLTYTPDGKYLLAGTTDKVFDWDNAKNTVDVWDVEAAKIVRKLEGDRGWIDSVAVSPDGKTAASIFREENLKLWDLATGEALHTLEGQEGKTLQFSPDGKLLAVGGAKGILLWDVATGKQHGKLEEPGVEHQATVVSLAFSPDGKTLAAGNWASTTVGGSTAYIWDVVKLERRARFDIDTNQGNHVAFSGDGKTLYVAGSGKTGVLDRWDVATEKRTASMKWEGYVRQMALTSDDKLLAMACDSEVKLWSVAADD